MKTRHVIFPLILMSMPGLHACQPEPETPPGGTDVQDQPAPGEAGELGGTAERAGEAPLADTGRSRTVRPRERPTTPGARGDEIAAFAELAPTEGNDARGSITLAGDDGIVRISGTVMGLEQGEHGFHVHETGDCSAPDASSAGGHFNPHDAPHGAPEARGDQRHVGDLGNIRAGADGVAQVDMEAQGMMLSGPDAVIGKALIVHAGRDDLQSQPSGDSGDRVACGVIKEGDQASLGFPDNGRD